MNRWQKVDKGFSGYNCYTYYVTLLNITLGYGYNVRVIMYIQNNKFNEKQKKYK